IQTEGRNRDQVADEEEWLHKRERQGHKEDREEDVEHALLRVLGADFDDLLAVAHRSLHYAVQLDVGFDELDRSISASGHGLRGSAGEPVDDGTARNKSEDEGSMQQRQLAD